tara:strand:- start:102 stop:353 length:252 start_codon:yes stop_codon:yes gene_type:complete
MKKNNMIKSTKKKETMKKTFLISVAKYLHKKLNHDELRKTQLSVNCKDWIDAIIEHDKVFKNNCDVENYLIIGDGKVSITNLK